ncbi:MAG: UDP-N-acetylmuramoyl-tripeptide--D-alanyl-D-alanine ligase [Treponemataceae bacterium]
MFCKAEDFGKNILLTFDEICQATSGEIVCNKAGVQGVYSVVLDSRDVKAGALFIPLRGMQQDGHKYCEASLQKGTVCFFVDRKFLAEKNTGSTNEEFVKALCEKYKATCIVVKNNLYALQDCAACYLKKFPKLLRIAVTGSSGKTTTKEILASIIGEERKTVFTKGNLNSETGLPLSIFTIRKDDEVAVFEFGMNRENEIAELAKIFQPSIALITNIGLAHVGMLGSQEKIALEKKKIFSQFDNTCTGFIPKSEFSEVLKKDVLGKIKVIDCEKNIFEKFLELKDLGEKGFEFIYEGEKIKFHLVGKHNLINAVMALSVAEFLKIKTQNIKKGLEKVKAIYGRAEIKEGRVKYLFDVYNANPQSMLASIEFLENLKVGGKKIAVLGSMMELGDYEFESHKKIIDRVLNSSIGLVFLYGDNFINIFEKLKINENKFLCFKTNEASLLKTKLKEKLEKDDFVLLKGSRGLQLEQFVPCLEADK